MNCCKHKLLIGPLGWQPLLTGLIKLSTAINWDLLGCQHKSLSATCRAPWQEFLTLFHTRGLGIVFLHGDGSLNIGFVICFFKNK
jgi:hypothetical protein